MTLRYNNNKAFLYQIKVNKKSTDMDYMGDFGNYEFMREDIIPYNQHYTYYQNLKPNNFTKTKTFDYDVNQNMKIYPRYLDETDFPKKITNYNIKHSKNINTPNNDNRRLYEGNILDELQNNKYLRPMLEASNINKKLLKCQIEEPNNYLSNIKKSFLNIYRSPQKEYRSSTNRFTYGFKNNTICNENFNDLNIDNVNNSTSPNELVMNEINNFEPFDFQNNYQYYQNNNNNTILRNFMNESYRNNNYFDSDYVKGYSKKKYRHLRSNKNKNYSTEKRDNYRLKYSLYLFDPNYKKMLFANNNININNNYPFNNSNLCYTAQKDIRTYNRSAISSIQRIKNEKNITSNNLDDSVSKKVLKENNLCEEKKLIQILRNKLIEEFKKVLSKFLFKYYNKYFKTFFEHLKSSDNNSNNSNSNKKYLGNIYHKTSSRNTNTNTYIPKVILIYNNNNINNNKPNKDKEKENERDRININERRHSNQSNMINNNSNNNSNSNNSFIYSNKNNIKNTHNINNIKIKRSLNTIEENDNMIGQNYSYSYIKIKEKRPELFRSLEKIQKNNYSNSIYNQKFHQKVRGISDTPNKKYIKKFDLKTYSQQPNCQEMVNKVNFIYKKKISNFNGINNIKSLYPCRNTTYNISKTNMLLESEINKNISSYKRINNSNEGKIIDIDINLGKPVKVINDHSPFEEFLIENNYDHEQKLFKINTISSKFMSKKIKPKKEKSRSKGKNKPPKIQSKKFLEEDEDMFKKIILNNSINICHNNSFFEGDYLRNERRTVSRARINKKIFAKNIVSADKKLFIRLNHYNFYFKTNKILKNTYYFMDITKENSFRISCNNFIEKYFDSFSNEIPRIEENIIEEEISNASPILFNLDSGKNCNNLNLSNKINDKTHYNLRGGKDIFNYSRTNSNLFGNCIKFFTKSLKKIINRIIFERIRIQARKNTSNNFRYKEQNNVSTGQLRLSQGCELGNIHNIKKRYFSYGGKMEK